MKLSRKKILLFTAILLFLISLIFTAIYLNSVADYKLLSLFAQIGSLCQLSPAKKEVQKKIEELQAFITKNYYKCTNKILSGLSQMYVCDERMKHNIDKVGGDGTADFVKQSVLIYCKNKETSIKHFLITFETYS